MSLDQHDGIDPPHGDSAAGHTPGVSMAEAVAEALASVRIEGVEPDPAALRVLDDLAAGRLTTGEALERVLAAARAA